MRRHKPGEGGKEIFKNAAVEPVRQLGEEKKKKFREEEKVKRTVFMMLGAVAEMISFVG